MTLRSIKPTSARDQARSQCALWCTPADKWVRQTEIGGPAKAGTQRHADLQAAALVLDELREGVGKLLPTNEGNDQ